MNLPSIDTWFPFFSWGYLFPAVVCALALMITALRTDWPVPDSAAIVPLIPVANIWIAIVLIMMWGLFILDGTRKFFRFEAIRRCIKSYFDYI